MTDPLAVMREVLESLLPEELAGYAMQHVLDSYQGGMPAKRSDVLALVRGPLVRTLSGRIPDPVRDDVVLRLESLFEDPDATITESSGRPDDEPALATSDLVVPHALTSMDNANAPIAPNPNLLVDIDVEMDPQMTEQIPNAGLHAVSVLNFAASRNLELKLTDELRQLIACKTVRTAAELRRAAFANAPLLVIVDATDAPPEDFAPLMGALRGLPDNVLIVVYGGDQRFGQRITEGLQEYNARHVTLSHREGIDPLLDLVTSRSTAS